MRRLWGICVALLFLFAQCFLHAGELALKEPTQSMIFEIDKSYRAVIHTNKGDIVCELDHRRAPLTVTNFILLVEKGFYNGLSFHHVVPNYIIQAGDPKGTGRGGPGYTLPSEIDLKHAAGALACARMPNEVNPEKRSSGSQFYITLDRYPHLDGEYSVFGQILSGIEVARRIRQGDVIESIEILTIDNFTSS